MWKYVRSNPDEPVKKRRNRPSIQLPPEIIERLGTVSDPTLARKAGVSPPVIAKARESRGIAPFFGYRDRSTPKAPKPAPKAVIAFEEHLPIEEFSRMGRVPDTQLEQEWGISRLRIAYARKKYGIPAFDPKK